MHTMGPEEEFNLFDRQRSWPAVFQKVRTDALAKHDFSVKVSKRPEFRNRNRYGDVSPYDHSRVLLSKNEIDYINASLIEASDANRAYILTQGPLPDTSGHFWLMVWEQNSKAILMLNRIIEKGQIKCHQYFPVGQDNEGEDEMAFNDVGLKVTFITETESNYHYTARVFEIQDMESLETKKVIQFHYTAWPDFGVPESPCAFLDFLYAVRESGALDDPSCPSVIHCSAGIGRSGTFCLVDACLVQLEKTGDLNSINVLEVLMNMRWYRMGLIQTHDQLRFSYLAIIEGSKRILCNSTQTPDLPTSNGNHNLDEYHDNVASSSDDDIEGDVTDNTDYENYDDDDEDDDATPPPIPPRGVPLDLRPAAVLPNDCEDKFENDSIHSNNTYNVNNGGVVPNGKSIEVSNDLHTPPTELHEIRRRAHDERVKNTAEQIARMKRRQQESEIWQTNQRRLRPYVIGVSVAVAISSYALYKCYWS